MKIGLVGHTVVKIHPAAVILAVVMVVLGGAQGLTAFLAALILHELAHGIVAALLHFSVPEIEFTPFGGVAKIEDLQSGTMGQQIMIALSGPMVNWLLSLAAYSVIQLGLADIPFMRRFLQANLILILFNLLPVLPLDGGRIVYALLAPRVGWQKAVRILSAGGVTMGALLVALAIWGALQYKTANFSLVITGCYLMYAANLSKKTLIPQCIHGMIAKKVHLERQGVLRVEIKAASAKSTVQALYRKLMPGSFHQVWVVDPSTLEISGCLLEAELEDALLSRPLDTLEDCLTKKHT